MVFVSILLTMAFNHGYFLMHCQHAEMIQQLRLINGNVKTEYKHE